MPFFGDFKTHFERGDLVFGLSQPRSHYVNHHAKFDGCTLSVCFNMFQIALPYDRKKDPGIEFFPEEDDFIDSLRGNIKNNILLSLEEEDHKNSPLIFTRKCKAGIRWAAYSEVAVHFILDELNLTDTALKVREYFTSGPRQGQRKGGVTASELRWIYRNRFDPRIIRSVQFWLNGDPVPPPWTHEFQIININQNYSADIWKLYEPKVVPKF